VRPGRGSPASPLTRNANPPSMSSTRGAHRSRPAGAPPRGQRSARSHDRAVGWDDVGQASSKRAVTCRAATLRSANGAWWAPPARCRGPSTTIAKELHPDEPRHVVGSEALPAIAVIADSVGIAGALAVRFAMLCAGRAGSSRHDHCTVLDDDRRDPLKSHQCVRTRGTGGSSGGVGGSGTGSGIGVGEGWGSGAGFGRGSTATLMQVSSPSPARPAYPRQVTASRPTRRRRP